ncbi:hypothetical protein [Nocardioides insulae]|uniref:hypothetical protein n=1 Tax=Nocardioides insulae TaxID=394734 RepID=UPI0003FFDD69|nr:hypothetical protein [Nocardioides insulae]
MAISHKRDTNARRTPRAVFLAAPLALVVTGIAVGAGVLSADPEPAADTTAGAGPAQPLEATDQAAEEPTEQEREPALSRSFSRLAEAKVVKAPEVERDPVDVMMAPAAVKKAVAGADTKLWATTDLNLWTLPADEGKNIGLVEEGDKVTVTGRKLEGREEIVVDGRSRWVTTGYFDDEKPVETGPDAEVSSAPCADTSVESGLTSGAVTVYRAVCNAFPEITSYGGYDAHGEHASGKAIDIMTSDETLGTQIAEFLKAHAAEFDLYDVIWRQQIWTPVRSSEGWRYMEDRGSTTANHYDHVHVSVN